MAKLPEPSRRKVPLPETEEEAERRVVNPEQRDRMQGVIAMFGTASQFGREVGVHRAQVHRWLTGQRELLHHHQVDILNAGKRRGIDLNALSYAIGVPRCPRCRTILDDDLREIVTGSRELEPDSEHA